MPQASVPSPAERSPAKHHATVLVVDDNPINVDLLESMLAEKDFEVAVAFHGEQALDLAPRLQPDIILMDVDMPGRSGFEICVALKSDPVTAAIPVIFVTAMRHELGRGFASGGVDYITKPISRTELLARLETHLALRRALTDLETARGSLEMQVNERTRELQETNERLKGEIDVRRHVEARLAYFAAHDRQTGLPNAGNFEEAARTYVQACDPDTACALVVLTLGHLQLFRDVVGPAASETHLRDVASAIRECAEAPALCGRLAPDRFALLLAADLELASVRATALLASLETGADEHAAALESLHLHVDILPMARGRTSVSDLIELATTFTREASRQPGSVRCHSPKTVGEVAEEREILTTLRGDLDAAGLELWRQPVFRVEATRDAPNHYEVLLRLRGADGTCLPPARFLGLAERYRLIERIDRWVVSQVVNFLRDHPNAPRHDVNLSAQAAASPAFGAWCVRHIRGHLDQPERLGVEITESAAIQHIEVASTLLRDLRDMGCSCALDDFGTGHASYGYLKELPLDAIKIDGSFIRDVPEDRVSTHLVQSMCGVGRALDLAVVAEQVEQEAAVRSLEVLGATHIQGFLTGRPAPLPRDEAAEGCASS